eukprot:CAMPEP_0179124240 /NCGR_PEP_ID=MMETSP0796-20121207/58704_1 /TAXON_ID=73915 /ORGANISM="Pyrodinium bahamense, Strain pbaha01" /LENGTH=52 /DNA_ID=CAMNT_0020822897 /DNA_START=77 /DNA_END=232 /DNA_ORIENTATION=+
MKISLPVAVLLLAMTTSARGTFEACESQSRFDIVMCKSYMCTLCTLAWCTEE